MHTTISRANLTILRRRMLALSLRRTRARTLSAGFALGAVPVAIFAVAWLFTGHMGAMEPLRLFIIALATAFLTTAAVAGIIATGASRALTVAEEHLIIIGAMPANGQWA